ncbi:MAG: class I SAM-dependent methyltransferase [Dehalococcoidia bacterium]
MNDDARLVVTSSRRASNATRAFAREKAVEWQFPYVDRSDLSLDQASENAAAVFVFRNDGLVLSTDRAQLRFDLGTAVLRLRAIERGESDQLMRAGELVSGDRVFDATLGLGRDALVASRVVGPHGQVVAVESNRALFTLVDEGLSSLSIGDDKAIIQRVLGDSRQILSGTPTSSFDVVVVDPMFNLPAKSDGTFEALREFADPSRLDPVWVRQARRVAKRWVIVKARYEVHWFNSEGLMRVPGMESSRWWRASGCSDS